jgi:hypothetical protein
MTEDHLILINFHFDLKSLCQYLVQKVLDKNFKIEYISVIKVRWI